MFIYITGEIKEIHKNSLFVETSAGLAFEVNVPSTTPFFVGSQAKLYIYTQIHNEMINLYGLSTYDSFKLFKLLNEVNGIGPKTALQILKNIEIDRFISYIYYEKRDELSKISGIGNKADRIITELRNKIGSFKINEVQYENVFDALIALGYDSISITKELNMLEDDLDDSEALKLAIRGLSK